MRKKYEYIGVNHFSGSVLMKIGNTAPIVVRIENIIMGRGGVNSASIGANMVEIFAPALQIPKAVPAKMAGNKNEFAR